MRRKNSSKESSNPVRVQAYIDHNLYELAVLEAKKQRTSISEVTKTALQEYLDPASAKKLEVVLGMRLDRLDRRMKALEQKDERHAETLMEAFALFVRYYLTYTPPIPENQKEAAKNSGALRYDGFIQTLAKQLVGRERLMQKIYEEKRLTEEDFTEELDLEGAA